MKPRLGRRVRLVDEVAALFGQLLVRPVVLRPRFPEGKGQDERTVSYLQTSFLPLRRFGSIEDLQDQHDSWARTVAFERYHRRVGAKVAEALRAHLPTTGLAGPALGDPEPLGEHHDGSPATVRG
ncbi:MAG: hypothetical protein ACLQNG_06945 [Acidimicrobiales bacterium]